MVRGGYMKKSEFNLFEVLVLVAIVLVTILTFFEDFASFAGFAGKIQNILMFAGFFFDFFFTVEFLARLYYARFDKGIRYYILHGYGWIDFFASIPLLMLSSGPQVAGYFFASAGGIGVGITATFFSLLKLIKIIRIARVLRLLRILKIFKTIKYTDTTMAQRHISKVITIGVTIVVLVLFITTGLMEFSNLKSMYDPSHNSKVTTFAYIEKKSTTQKDERKLVENLTSMDALHNVLLISLKGKILYSRAQLQQDLRNINPADYDHFSNNGLDVYFDTRIENELQSKSQSKDILIFYFVILFLIVGYLVLYSPHFALTITDPIKIMKRGMTERDYNLEVKIPGLFESDEIYELAESYNDHYLPLKDRNKDSQASSGLSLSEADMDDIFELDTEDD
jgi:hypothetical protein